MALVLMQKLPQSTISTINWVLGVQILMHFYYAIFTYLDITYMVPRFSKVSCIFSKQCILQIVCAVGLSTVTTIIELVTENFT